MSAVPQATLDWLMEGDPVIRWQTMQDLLDLDSRQYQEERQRTLNEGWVARTLALRGPDGHWKRERWTGDVWTLSVLVKCGIPPYSVESLEHSVDELFSDYFPQQNPAYVFKNWDMCHVGFWVGIGSYFLAEDPRVKTLAQTLLSFQMDDGGWNCRMRMKPKTHHGSFHTTFNVLEGLRVAACSGVLSAAILRTAEVRAMEFVLAHRMFKSDKTGEIIDPKFLNLTFPAYWHYNVLRGLDYMRLTPEIRDPRLEDAIEYLMSRRDREGRWPVEKRIPGVVHFDMEPMGKPSRWNTLRALRVLKARS